MRQIPPSSLEVTFNVNEGPKVKVGEIKVLGNDVMSKREAVRVTGAKPEDFKKGVELIHKQLLDVLQKMNVQMVPAQGQPFDPRVHEAIEMVESDQAEGLVATIRQRNIRGGVGGTHKIFGEEETQVINVGGASL